MQGVLAFVAGFGVEAVENPAAGLYGAFGFTHTFGHINPVSDTVGVRNYEGRTVVSIGFRQGLDGLVHIGTHSHLGYIDVTVGHRNHTEVFLRHLFAARGEQGFGTQRGGFGHLAAGVGIDFRIQHQDFDVLATG